MQTNHILRIFCTIIIILIFQNCESESQRKEKAYLEKMEKIKADINKTLADLPPPSTIPQTLFALGIDFNNKFIHDLSKLDSYLSDDDRAAFNLGVYAADISLLITYDRVHESVEHFDACKQLSKFLGVAEAFDLETIHRYENNMGQHDELIDLMNESILEAQQSLTQSDRIPMAALVLTGSFIEGLYIAVMAMENYPNTPNRVEELQPIIQVIIGEEEALLDIITLLKDLPQDAVIANVMSELEVLELLYRTDLKDMDSNTLVTPEKLKDVNYEITRIRKKITS